VIGGGDWSDDRIIPDIVRSLQNGAPVEVRNPNAVRPWQHVLEPMAGYLLLGGLLNEHATEFSRAFNFGPAPEDHLSVSQLVEIAIREWGSGNWKDVSAEGQPHEAGLLKLDISLAEHELGWVPKLRSEQAVKWAIDWYKMPINKQAEFAFQQIKSYFDL